MSSFTLLIILIVIATLCAYLNTRFFKLPDSIGVMVLSMAFSLFMLGLDGVYPAFFTVVQDSVAQLDFNRIVFDFLLSFLLFAGAFHTDAAKLRVERRSVIILAILGVLLSTAFIGTGLYYVADGLGLSLPYSLCLLFGALISPTDPIAVLGILAKFKLPESVKLNIVGESLFNDGVAVVVFASIYRIVLGGSGSVSIGDFGLLFLEEAGGGIVFGLILGYGMYRLIRTINHYQTEVLITLAGVMGGYALAQALHVSGPLAMVVAGLLVGDRARKNAMSATSEDYVDKFWELLDVVLNSLLFVLMGLELLVIDLHWSLWVIYLLVILIVIVSRYLAIIIPFGLARRWLDLDDKAPLMLTWGGLRGGISIALALSIDDAVPHKDFIVTITYAAVLFSVIVQGLTMEKLIKRLYPEG
jgi:CPA1 family monovalent cation:H+ antiporter